MLRPALLLLLLLGLAACSTPQRAPVPVTPAGERAGAAVVRTPLPDTEPGPPVVASIPPARHVVPPTSRSDVTPPGDAIYVCVVDRPGGREQTVIEFAPKVHGLCKRHPEMGFRSCLGILRLAKTSPAERMEAAARRCLRARAYNCQSMDSILKNKRNVVLLQ